MISIPAAKALLFVALTLGPSHPTKIMVVSNSENYIWTYTTTGWQFKGPGFPASDFTREPSQSGPMSPKKADDFQGPTKEIAEHDWSQDSIMVLENGDRVEKRNGAGFYILRAGCPNQKIYTILYDDKIVQK